MKPRLFISLIGLSCMLAACSPVDSLQRTPLTAAETQLVGTWTAMGPGITKTYAFGSDRMCEFTSNSALSGVLTGEYVWEADGSLLKLYTPGAAFFEPEEVDGYSFVSSSILQIENEQYTKQ